MANPDIRSALQAELEEVRGTFKPGVRIASLRLSGTFLDELDELLAWAREENRVQRTADPVERAEALQSARRLLRRLRGVSRWHARTAAPFRLCLRTLEENHARAGASARDLALQLDDYVALMEPAGADLEGLAGFRLDRLEEAKALSRYLLGVGKCRRIRMLRNKLLEMIERRYATLRDGARLLFADHAHLLDDFTYRRTRRRATQVAEVVVDELEVEEVAEVEEVEAEVAEPEVAVEEEVAAPPQTPRSLLTTVGVAAPPDRPLNRGRDRPG